MRSETFAVIELDGSPLSLDMMSSFESVVVESSLSLPDSFTARFVDPACELLPWFASKLGASAKVSLSVDGEAGLVQVMDGQVTAVEVDCDDAGTRSVVRGMDTAYRLQGTRKTRSWLNAIASDVAREIAGGAGLTPGVIDATTITYPHLVQANMTDLEFLKRLAAENNRSVVVADGALQFRCQPSADEGPSAGSLSNHNPLQLVLHGDRVRSLRAIIRSAGQVGEVQVRGWDPAVKREVVGTAKAGTSAASAGTGPAELAAKGGASEVHVSVTTPVSQTSEADQAAADLADHLGSTFAEIEGRIEGHPRLSAGRSVSISNFGPPVDGKFKVSTVTHRLDARGYETSFMICGQQDRSLLGLVSGDAAAGDDGRIPGVVPAIVTDNDDPDQLGRVKVSFPWLDASYKTDWCRMAQFGAGQGRGALFLPEVGDEVLVAFEQGHTRRAYVIGGLYNGVDKPNTGESLVNYAAVSRRGYVSKQGSMLVFFEDPGDDGIALITGDKGLKVSLNRTKTTVHIASNGEVTIEGTNKVTVDGGKELVLTGQRITVGSSSTQAVEVSGAEVSVKGTAKVGVVAPQVSLG